MYYKNNPEFVCLFPSRAQYYVHCRNCVWAYENFFDFASLDPTDALDRNFNIKLLCKAPTGERCK